MMQLWSVDKENVIQCGGYVIPGKTGERVRNVELHYALWIPGNVIDS